MGNDNSQNINEDKYYMSVNLIGKTMKDLLTAISGLSYSSKSSERSSKVSIYDYWDYSYLHELNFISQVNILMDK